MLRIQSGIPLLFDSFLCFFIFTQFDRSGKYAYAGQPQFVRLSFGNAGKAGWYAGTRAIHLYCGLTPGDE